MGNNENRFKVYENEFKKGSSEKGGVLFFNNIESDNTFKEYTTDREEAYLELVLINLSQIKFRY